MHLVLADQAGHAGQRRPDTGGQHRVLPLGLMIGGRRGAGRGVRVPGPGDPFGGLQGGSVSGHESLRSWVVVQRA